MEETLERTSSSPNSDGNNNSNSNNSKNLSPFLQGMVDEQRQLQMNVGKAMDTLRKDYPYFLKRSPGEYLYLFVGNVVMTTDDDRDANNHCV